MKYLIVEPKVKAIAPNIALMKWARWCELEGYEYQYIRGMVKPTIIPDIILMSCIFSYYSKKYEKTIDYYRNLFPNAKFIVGGVFPTLNPKWFSKWQNPFMDDFQTHCGIHPDIENLVPLYNVPITHEKKEDYSRNKIVLYASRGCVNKCGYCAVPKLEGDMKSFASIQKYLIAAKEELPQATSVVLYDNNFTEHKYFDDIVSELRDFDLPVDIHGLHVESFTQHQADQFATLKWGSQGDKGTAYLRFSFDKMKYEPYIDRAMGYVKEADIKAAFFCYMLFNYTDTPDGFWERIMTSQRIVDKHKRTLFLFPQRYEPFMALKRNTYIGKHWDETLVRGVTRMYTFLHGFIPLTTTRNVFKWIGRTKEEFLDRAYKMGSDSKYRLKKL